MLELSTVEINPAESNYLRLHALHIVAKQACSRQMAGSILQALYLRMVLEFD